MKPISCACIPPLLLLCAIAAGCGSKEDKAPATQVAAKVNATEITVSQVNNVLARTPNVTPDAEPRVKREILDNLIDQQLARQQAIESKLDRTPAVLQNLEAAKTEILARAYVEKFAAAQGKPTPEEIKKYYDEHPALFSQRRVYSIEEIALKTQEGLAGKLRAQAASTRTLEQIATWLKSQDLKFTAVNGVRNAEQIPIEYLETMQSMKDGDIAVLETRGGVQVLRLVASKTVPVDEAAAAPRIQQFLFNQRLDAALAGEMKLIRERAKVAYVGEFGVAVGEAEAKVKTQGEAKAKAAADAKAKADEAANTRAQAIAKAAVEAQERADARTKARVQEDQERQAANAKAPPRSQAPIAQDSIEKGIR